MRKHRMIKKIIPFVLAIFLLILSMPFMASAASEPTEIPLVAGQNTEIGTIFVSDDGDTMTVRFEVDEPGWYMTAIHLYVGTRVPKSAPGKFNYKVSGLYATTYTFTVDIDPGRTYDVAGHADASNTNVIVGWTCPSMDELAAMLPASGSMYQLPRSGFSLFDLVLTSENILKGTHPAWCIDRTHTGDSYIANFLLSLGSIPDCLTTGENPHIDHPENLDLVNWVLNNDSGFSGEEGMMSVQNVIWHLLDDYPLPALTEQEQALYDAAVLYGQDFEPDLCTGEIVGIIVVPVAIAGECDIRGQIYLIEFNYRTPLYKGETAWGLPESGGVSWTTGWGQHFHYTTQQIIPV